MCGAVFSTCVVQAANMGQHLAGGNSSRCPELEVWTAHHRLRGGLGRAGDRPDGRHVDLCAWGETKAGVARAILLENGPYLLRGLWLILAP